MDGAAEEVYPGGEPQEALLTIRRRIAEMLRVRPFTLRELGLELGLREREVLDHLQHVARSLCAQTRLRVEPARCLHCDFVFRKRTRLSTPGRCPHCRSQRIQPPEFSVQE